MNRKIYLALLALAVLIVAPVSAIVNFNNNVNVAEGNPLPPTPPAMVAEGNPLPPIPPAILAEGNPLPPTPPAEGNPLPPTPPQLAVFVS